MAFRSTPFGAFLSQSFRNYGRTTFSSLGVRNYRLYFTGQAISMTGTWMQSIGQSWLVLKLTGSGTALGLVAALQTLPVLLFGPLGGVLADRVPKRRLLFCTQGTAGLLALILGVLVATGAIRLWMLFILAASLGLVSAMDNPARQSFVSEMVPAEKLGNAVTLNSTEINLTRVIGPAIAGVLIAKVGLASCFFINSVSYVAVLVCLAMMRSGDLFSARPVSRAKGQLREGFRYVRDTLLVRDILVMMAIVGTLTFEFQVSLPLVAKFAFHGGAGSYATLTSAMGLGAVFGGLAAAGRKRTVPRGLIGAAAAFGVAVLLVSVSPSLAFAAAAMAVVGAASINFTTRGNTLVQLECEPAMRSRVMSLWAVAFMGSTPIGGPIIGWVGEYAGPRWSLAVGGLACLAAAAFGAVVMRRYPRTSATREVGALEAAPDEKDRGT